MCTNLHTLTRFTFILIIIFLHNHCKILVDIWFKNKFKINLRNKQKSVDELALVSTTDL